MVSLTREIRFSLNAGDDSPAASGITNSWGGWPAAERFAPYVKLQCTLEGEIDTTTGYLYNVKDIDGRMRELVAVPACRDWKSTTPEQMCLEAFEKLSSAFPSQLTLTEVTLSTTPSLTFHVCKQEHPMIRMTQQFEFSASHRLHNAELSDEKNRELFGKCNNPHGHGHNYQVDVTVTGEVDKQSGLLVNLVELEQTVKSAVIDPLDHKYLNIEIDEFQELIPSVENIAMVIWNRLQTELDGPRLENIRVYETPKTWADYRR